jgi:hypothetical protein
MRASMIACLLVFSSLPAFAHAQESTRSDAEVFAQAETAFRLGVENKTNLLQTRRHFSEATDACFELHRRGVRSPALYLNLGNAAVLADRWPEAVWAYHVGLKLDPNDAGLRDHLAFARGKVLYPASGQGRPDADAWPAWLHRPTVYELFCIGNFSYLLAWVAGTSALLARSSRLVLAAGVWLLIAALCGGALGLQLEQADADRQTPLIVLANNAEFYRGNGASYPQHPAMPVLPRGLEARQVHRRGGWVQIRLTTGEVGWVPLDRVLVVEP